MAGSKWKSKELKIIVACDQEGTPHETVRSRLFQASGSQRSTVAIRCKLKDLRQESHLFDPTTRKWIDGGVRSRIQEMELNEREDQGEDDDENDDGDMNR